MTDIQYRAPRGAVVPKGRKQLPLCQKLLIPNTPHNEWLSTEKAVMPALWPLKGDLEKAFIS
jgi:hypothetical protein